MDPKIIRLLALQQLKQLKQEQLNAKLSSLDELEKLPQYVKSNQDQNGTEKLSAPSCSTSTETQNPSMNIFRDVNFHLNFSPGIRALLIPAVNNAKEIYPFCIVQLCTIGTGKFVLICLKHVNVFH